MDVLGIESKDCKEEKGKQFFEGGEPHNDEQAIIVEGMKELFCTNFYEYKFWLLLIFVCYN